MVQVPARGPGGRPHLLLEWEGGTLGDMVADAAVAIVLQARCSRHVHKSEHMRWARPRLEHASNAGGSIGCALRSDMQLYCAWFAAAG